MSRLQGENCLAKLAKTTSFWTLHSRYLQGQRIVSFNSGRKASREDYETAISAAEKMRSHLFNRARIPRLPLPRRNVRGAHRQKRRLRAVQGAARLSLSPGATIRIDDRQPVPTREHRRRSLTPCSLNDRKRRKRVARATSARWAALQLAKSGSYLGSTEVLYCALTAWEII